MLDQKSCQRESHAQPGYSTAVQPPAPWFAEAFQPSRCPSRHGCGPTLPGTKHVPSGSHAPTGRAQASSWPLQKKLRRKLSGAVPWHSALVLRLAQSRCSSHHLGACTETGGAVSRGGRAEAGAGRRRARA